MTHGKARSSLPFRRTRTQGRPGHDYNVMCELLQADEKPADRAGGTAPRARKEARMRDTGARAAMWALFALLLGLSALGVFDTRYVNQQNRPSDAQLRSNFLSHEAAFEDLVRMLDRDKPTLAAGRTAVIDLSALAGLGTSAARTGRYRRLLRRISVADFRYFTDSGKLILVPDGQQDLRRPSKSYLYLPHGQPQPFVQDHGYDWRGPGIYLVTGDRPLRGPWFIHHDMTMELAGLPY